MKYLVDTNVLSELQKRRPHSEVERFFQVLPDNQIFLSVLTLGELRRGGRILLRKDADAARRLEGWIDGITMRFADNILAIDLQTALIWGEFSADRSRDTTDTLLAATAARHDLIMATRNTQHFAGLPIRVINPWLQQVS